MQIWISLLFPKDGIFHCVVGYTPYSPRLAVQVEMLNSVNLKLPFLPADEDVEVKEEVRLRHRVLDLRWVAHLTKPRPQVAGTSSDRVLTKSTQGTALVLGFLGGGTSF
jgi:hypothetical protein